MILDFEELFGRRKRHIHLESDAQRFYTGMRIAITGGAGSIGSSIAIQLLKETDADVFVLDSDESRLHTFLVNLPKELRSKTRTQLTDVRDRVSTQNAIDKINPDLVIHSAALKHVSILENEPREAYLTNVLGTSNVLKAIKNSSVKHFIFISTDKAANPINILGKTKLIGEYLTAGISRDQSSIKCSVVRFGNVFLSRGSVIETFLAQIRLGETLTVTHEDVDRFFLDLQEASSLILQTATKPHSGISILKMGDPVKIIGLVKKISELFKIEVKYDLVGLVPGEKLTEELFTQKELQQSINYEDYLFSSFSKFIESNLIDEMPYSSNEKCLESINYLVSNANEL
jgi:FlaA1/EpsC-like NDP-sugar epimerase